MKLFFSLPLWARCLAVGIAILPFALVFTSIGRFLLLQGFMTFVVAQISLGFFEAFTKPFAIRRSQNLLLGVATKALEGLDKVFPEVIAEGLDGDALRERVRVYLKSQTDISWDRLKVDLEDRGSTLEEGIEQGIDLAQKLFSPEVLLNKLLKTRA